MGNKLSLKRKFNFKSGTGKKDNNIFSGIQNAQKLAELPRAYNDKLWVFHDDHQRCVKSAISQMRYPDVIAEVICSFFILFHREYGYFRICHSAVNKYIADGNQVKTGSFQSRTEINLTVVVSGMDGVGKSNLIIRLVCGTFADDYIPRISDDYRTLKHVPGFGDTLLTLIDTGGEDGYPLAMEDHYFRQCDMLLCCFRMDKTESLDRLANDLKKMKRIMEWDDGMNSKGAVLVACQMDRIYDDDYRTCRDDRTTCIDTAKRARELSSTWNIPLIETSAKRGINVDALSIQIVYEHWLQTNTKSIQWDKIH